MADEPLTTGRIAELVGGRCQGDPAVRIESVASLDQAGPGQLTFAADSRRAARLTEAKAAAAIVPEEAELASTDMPLIRVPDVQAALARLLGYLSRPEDRPPVGVDSTASISAGAELAADVRVGPGVVIAAGAEIGRASTLAANVTIGSDVKIGRDVVLSEGVVVRQGCRIGHRVRIGPNSVIGYEGFGYYFADGQHRKIPHAGNVVIEDDVEIGACACIDRAKFGSTRIGAGTKIDNLVQVAHNVQIGRDCVIAGLCGIAGSASLGQYVALGGHVGIRDNICLGRGVTCAAYTAVANDVPDGQTMFGIPAIGAREKFRQISLTGRLPEIVKRIKELEERLSSLESSKDH